MYYHLVHRACGRTDLHQKQQISLQQVGCLAPNHWVNTIQSHPIIVNKLPRAKTIDLGSTSTNTIHCIGMVIRHYRSHFQALTSVISILHSTCHTAHNQPPAQVGVSNSSGPALRVWVSVRPEPAENSRSRLSIYLYCPFAYGSREIFPPIRNGRVVSGLPCGSISEYI